MKSYLHNRIFRAEKMDSSTYNECILGEKDDAPNMDGYVVKLDEGDTMWLSAKEFNEMYICIDGCMYNGCVDVECN